MMHGYALLQLYREKLKLSAVDPTVKMRVQRGLKGVMSE